MSGLYDADLEAQLIQFALKVCKILLATNVPSISDAADNAEILPVNAQCGSWNTDKYLGSATTRVVQIRAPGEESTYDNDFMVQSSVNTSATLVKTARVEDLEASDVISGITGTVQCENTPYFDATTLSDAATYNLINSINNCGIGVFWGGDADPTIVTIGGEGEPIFANLAAVAVKKDALDFFAAAGVRVKSDNTLEANQLRVLGSRVCWWLKCF